ncbi:MAG TPA: hypothetical protein PKD83_10465 [Ignavibacteria bacterium]|nr:hypothetical protein [Ignavibacteria bacterium]
MKASIYINFATATVTFVFGVLLTTGIIYQENKGSTKFVFGIVLMIYGVYRFINTNSKLKQIKMQEKLDKLNSEKEKFLNEL